MHDLTDMPVHHPNEGELWEGTWRNGRFRLRFIPFELVDDFKNEWKIFASDGRIYQIKIAGTRFVRLA